MPRSRPVECSFNLGGLVLKGQAWGEPIGTPLLALHGWLDNSASFAPLAPLLHNTYCIALDLAGHGHSDHRSGLAGYPLLDDVVDIFAVADQLGWERFALLGHSRGAMISFLAAGSLPERISHLLMIDALAPPATKEHRAPERMARSIGELHTRGSATKRIYRNFEHALDVRCESPFPIARQAATLITERGVTPVDGGVSWRSDNKLQATSNYGLSQSQIDAYAGRIVSDMHVIIANQGLNHPQIRERIDEVYSAAMRMLDKLPIGVSFVDGGHYLHMEEPLEQVAAIVNQCLLQAEA